MSWVHTLPWELRTERDHPGARPRWLLSLRLDSAAEANAVHAARCGDWETAAFPVGTCAAGYELRGIAVTGAEASAIARGADPLAVLLRDAPRAKLTVRALSLAELMGK